MDRLTAIGIFVEVVQRKSFSAAARHIRIGVSTVSEPHRTARGVVSSMRSLQRFRVTPDRPAISWSDQCASAERRGRAASHSGRSKERVRKSMKVRTLGARWRVFLGCGQLERGFARVRCDACRFECLVPFSCKAKGDLSELRRAAQAEQAAHLVDAVLPWVTSNQPSPRKVLLARAIPLRTAFCMLSVDVLGGAGAHALRAVVAMGRAFAPRRKDALARLAREE
jgi:hypothetical protein